MISNTGSGLIVGYESVLHPKLQTAAPTYRNATLAGQSLVFTWCG